MNAKSPAINNPPKFPTIAHRVVFIGSVKKKQGHEDDENTYAD